MFLFRKNFLQTMLLACATKTVLFAEQSVDFGKDIQPIFKRHCIECHGMGGKVKGKVNLFEIENLRQLTADPDLLETLLGVIEDSEMPPEDQPSLPASVRGKLIVHLESLLAQSLNSGKGLARTPIRRMNRFQYNNSVKDLLQLKVEVYPLPERMMRDRNGYFRPESGKMPDKMTVSSRPLGKSGLIEPRLGGVAPFPQDLRAEHGYDNQGDHLSLSPFLMENFLTLSNSILNSPTFGPKTSGIWSTFFAPPDDKKVSEEMVRQRLSPFLMKAFRRPAEKNVLTRYTQHAFRLIQGGMNFTDAMKQVASAVLASPRFLYLYENSDNSSGPSRVDDFELASRLSFFLWGTLPDENLLEEASKGELSQPEMLRNQIARMLKDRKLKRFCDSFPTQWLQLDRIISSVPDVKKYPDFYYAPPNYRTTMDMMMEPLLLFETVLIENRSILEFIDSDFSYRSPRLERWYDPEKKSSNKLGGPVTLNFKRVPIQDRRQGGVITSAAVLTMTSGPEETKPITRGAWIAGVIFNDPPEPPPADVPPLPKADPETLKNLTIRERFVAHRERADCAVCHNKLDPLGFALENYDPVGRWRNSYENGLKVDPSGVLLRKHQFNDISAFKDAILAEKDRFVRGFSAHLLAYALGREVNAADSPALDSITKAAADSDYKIARIIEAVVMSEPFQTKYTKE